MFHGKGVLRIRNVNSSLSRTFQPYSWRKICKHKFLTDALANKHLTLLSWLSPDSSSSISHVLSRLKCPTRAGLSAAPGAVGLRCCHCSAVAKWDLRSWAWFSSQKEKKKNLLLLPTVICYNIFIPCRSCLLSNCTIDLNFINIYLLMLV